MLVEARISNEPMLKATHLQHILVCQFSRSPGRSSPRNISDTTGCRDQISQLPVIRSSCVIIGAHTQSHKTSQKKHLLVFTPLSKCITSHFLMKENKMLSCTWLLPRNAFTIQLPGWRPHTLTHTHPRRFLGQQDVQKLSDWLLMPLVSEWEFAPRCCMFLCCYCRHVFHSPDWQPSTSAL